MRLFVMGGVMNEAVEGAPAVSGYEEMVEPYLADAWPRFWARLFDINLLSWPVGF